MFDLDLPNVFLIMPLGSQNFVLQLHELLQCLITVKSFKIVQNLVGVLHIVLISKNALSFHTEHTA